MSPKSPNLEEAREGFARITETLAASAAREAVRHQVSTLTGWKAQPTAVELDRIEALYVEEGFRDVQAIPAQGQSGRGWDVSVFAAGNPYTEARP